MECSVVSVLEDGAIVDGDVDSVESDEWVDPISSPMSWKCGSLGDKASSSLSSPSVDIIGMELLLFRDWKGEGDSIGGWLSLLFWEICVVDDGKSLSFRLLEVRDWDDCMKENGEG